MISAGEMAGGRVSFSDTTGYLFVQNQGAVLKKSSLRGVHPGDFPSRQGENERGPISCAHSSWIKRSTLLCRKITRVHPVVSFPHYVYLYLFPFTFTCITCRPIIDATSKLRLLPLYQLL